MITLLTALLIGVTNITIKSDTTLAMMGSVESGYSICRTTSCYVTAEGIIRDMENADITEEVVKKLAAGGHICAVFGHQWRDGRPGETETRDWNGNVIAISQYLDYHPGISYRTCRICGKCESKTEGEWK